MSDENFAGNWVWPMPGSPEDKEARMAMRYINASKGVAAMIFCHPNGAVDWLRTAGAPMMIAG